MKKFWLILLAITLPFMAATIISKNAKNPPSQGGSDEPTKVKPINDKDTQSCYRW